MKYVDDTTQTARSSNPEVSLWTTRRDVIVTGTGIGLLATTGVSGASNHETSSDDGSAPGTNPLTITVTGLEIDGPLKDCVVEYENERKTSDESGTVVFENGDGPYEVTVEKEGWHDKTETIEAEGNQQEVYILMHAADPLDN